MQHLDVFTVRERAIRAVILQYPNLDTGDIVLTAPLFPERAAKPIPVITPLVQLDGETLVVGTHLLAGIRKTGLVEHVGTLEPHRYDISRAIDRLFFGN